MPNYRHLLLAVDIYEDSDVLFTEALRLQAFYQAKLSVVHVTPHLVSSMPYAHDFQDAVASQAHKSIREFKDKYNLQQDDFYLEEGNPKSEVVLLAKKINADLIICGSHGKHGLELALGSTANGILHLATCDVLTIRLNDEGQHLVSVPYKNIVVATDLQNDNTKVLMAAQTLSAQYQARLHVMHLLFL